MSDKPHVNIHHVKLKSRKEMARTIPRDRLGWWHDVSPGERMVLRDATAADLARCNLREGDTRGPADFLCELPADGSLVSLEAIEFRRTDVVYAAPLTREAATVPSGIVDALHAAQRFIRNGVEFGYIRMPDADCPDPAHDTPKKIDAALAMLASAPAQQANGEAA